MAENKTKDGKWNSHSLLLVLTAMIWGVAFVAQKKGGDAAGAYTFNCIRFLMGGLVLLPLIHFLKKKNVIQQNTAETEARKRLFTGGILCGCLLGIASLAQQLGILYGTSSGKAGFLTSCYIILVPFFGIFLKRKCSPRIWLAVPVTVFGLYLLCMKGSFYLQTGDALVLLCSALFAVHILAVDYFLRWAEAICLSCIQFFTAGILSAIPMFFLDMRNSPAGIAGWLSGLSGPDSWFPIVYAGIFSCGIGYTLQTVGQKKVPPAVAALLLSLESVFSVIAGGLLAGERLSGKELLGCALIFAAVIFSQLEK